MINYVFVRVKATKRDDYVLFVLAREKSFGELVKNMYLPGHSLEILGEFCKAKKLGRVWGFEKRCYKQ